MSFAATFFSATANGVGVVLSAGGGAYLIERATGTKNPFGKGIDIIKFILFGALLGPAVSALFSATALCTSGFLPWDSYGYTLLTWWTGGLYRCVDNYTSHRLMGNQRGR